MAEDIRKVQMKDVRLSFPQLFRPKAFGDGSQGEPAFSAEFLIPKDSSLGKKIINMIEDAIDEAKVKQWGEDDRKWPKISKDKPFWKDGDDDDYARPETEGCMIVSARNLKKPRVLGIDKEDLHESDGIIYAGCYVDAIVRVWAQDNKYGKRINCSLEAVRFRRDGDAFGAAPIDPDEFEDIDGGDDDRGGSRRGGRGRDDDRGSRRGGRDEERSSSRRGRDDDDDRGSRRGRDEDDDRGSRGRGRDDDDDRGSRRGRDRDEEDDRGSRRGRDRDDDGDDRGSSRRSNRDDDDDRNSSRRGRDDDSRDDDRRSSRRSRDDDDGDRDRGSSRRGRDEDDEDRPSGNSRSSRRGRDRDDDGI